MRTSLLFTQYARRAKHARAASVFAEESGSARNWTPLNAELFAEYSARAWARRSDPEREKAMRLRTETVELPDVNGMDTPAWRTYAGHKMTCRLARYCNVFADCFPEEFEPSVNLRVRYGDAGKAVYRGNILAPAELQAEPTVVFDAEQGKRYALMLLSPDDCIFENGTNTLHWLKTDISHDGTGGKAVCPYVPPTPPHGTGFHRYVFAVFEQRPEWEAPTPPPATLRPFDSAEFVRQHGLVPRGLAFMQCTWDASVAKNLVEALGLSHEPSWSAPPQ